MCSKWGLSLYVLPTTAVALLTCLGAFRTYGLKTVDGYTGVGVLGGFRELDEEDDDDDVTGLGTKEDEDDDDDGDDENVTGTTESDDDDDI